MAKKEFWKRGVELWKAGTTVDGRIVKASRVQKVFENTVKILEKITNFKISVKPDGHWSMSEKISGTVENLRKVENIIVGDLKFKIKEIWDDITDGSFIAPSAEITTLEGFGEILSAVALIGNSIPAFPDLKGLFDAEVENMFCMDKMKWDSHKDFFDIAKNNEEENNMNEEMKKLLESFAVKFETIENALAAKDISKEEKEILVKENNDIKTQFATLKTQVEAFEIEKENKLNSDIDIFVNKLIEDKKISASEKEKLTVHFKSLSKEGVFNIDNFKEDMLFNMINNIKPEKEDGDTIPVGDEAKNTDLGAELGNEETSYALYDKTKQLHF